MLLNIFSSMLSVAGYAVNLSDLKNAGIIMGLGMLGIFIVIVLIYLVVILLAKLFPEKKKD